jgi:hypothetical protein
MLLISLALAATPAYYLPNDVAASSKLFTDTSAEMAPRFEEAQSRVGQVSQALEQLDLGVSLLGSKAPEGMPDWAAKTRRNLTGQYLRLQRHLGRMQDDYSGVFGDALSRVLPTVSAGYDLKECGNTGVMAQFKRSTCTGENLNPVLAAALDKDAALQAALTEIRSLEWPTISIETRTWAPTPLTGSARTVQLSVLAKSLLADQLAQREAELEEAMGPLTEGLENKDAAAIAEAQKLKDQWRANLGKDGEAWQALIAEALGRLEKKGGPAQVGLCGNPVLLGGCEGEDVTAKVQELLAADKKFLRGTAGL